MRLHQGKQNASSAVEIRAHDCIISLVIYLPLIRSGTTQPGNFTQKPCLFALSSSCCPALGGWDREGTRTGQQHVPCPCCCRAHGLHLSASCWHQIDVLLVPDKDPKSPPGPGSDSFILPDCGIHAPGIPGDASIAELQAPCRYRQR